MWCGSCECIVYSCVDNLHDHSGARGGAGFFRNMFEMLLDGLFREFHFVGDFLIGPTFQEMLNDRCFAYGQVKPLRRLDDNLVLPRTDDPGLVHHDEDSCSRVGLINQGRAAQEHGALERVHDASELNLLPVLRVRPDFEGLLDLMDETHNGLREHPVCCFSVLGANDLLAQFPCPPIFIE